MPGDNDDDNDSGNDSGNDKATSNGDGNRDMSDSERALRVARPAGVSPPARNRTVSGEHRVGEPGSSADAPVEFESTPPFSHSRQLQPPSTLPVAEPHVHAIDSMVESMRAVQHIERALLELLLDRQRRGLPLDEVVQYARQRFSRSLVETSLFWLNLVTHHPDLGHPQLTGTHLRSVRYMNAEVAVKRLREAIAHGLDAPEFRRSLADLASDPQADMSQLPVQRVVALFSELDALGLRVHSGVDQVTASEARVISATLDERIRDWVADLCQAHGSLRSQAGQVSAHVGILDDDPSHAQCLSQLLQEQGLSVEVHSSLPAILARSFHVAVLGASAVRNTRTRDLIQRLRDTQVASSVVLLTTRRRPVHLGYKADFVAVRRNPYDTIAFIQRSVTTQQQRSAPQAATPVDSTINNSAGLPDLAPCLPSKKPR